MEPRPVFTDLQRKRMRWWSSKLVSVTVQLGLGLFFLLFAVTAVFDYIMLDRALYIGELTMKEITANWALYAPYTKAMCVAQRQLSAVLHNCAFSSAFGLFIVFFRRYVDLTRKTLSLIDRPRP